MPSWVPFAAPNFNVRSEDANNRKNIPPKSYNVAYLDGSATFSKDPSMTISFLAGNYINFDIMYTVWKTFDRWMIIAPPGISFEIDLSGD